MIKFLFQILLLIFLGNLVWRVIKLYLPKIEKKSEVKGGKAKKSFHIDKSQIEDAKFEEIKEPKDKKK